MLYKIRAFKPFFAVYHITIYLILLFLDKAGNSCLQSCLFFFHLLEKLARTFLIQVTINYNGTP